MRVDRASPYAGMIDPRTRQRIPGPPEDKRVLYAELDYPFEGKPERLTIIPPLDAEGIPAVTIGFIAYHKAVPIIDFRYLSQPSRLSLDWADPWYTAFDNPNLSRHHKSALMSFLYVEPREVRHEALVRVRDLEDWTDLNLGDGATIDLAEQDRIKEHARGFFASRNPVTIDDTAVTPTAARAEFLDLSLTGVRVIEDGRPLDPTTAILGIILSYPVAHLPQHVAVRWELFNERVDRIPATSVDPAGPLPGFIDTDDPVLEWRNFLHQYQEPAVSPVVIDDGRSIGVPVLSLALMVIALGAAALAFRPRILPRPAWITATTVSMAAAIVSARIVVVDVPKPWAGPPDEATSTQILSGVLANVNHAYLETDPETLRRKLQTVVADEGFPEVRQELDRALAIRVAGGGIARVDTVEDISLQDLTLLEDRSGFRSVAEWTANASAGHWGHVHRRTIRFRALVELVEAGGAWKLAGITVVDARQET